ncbi:MAG: TetR/AcrR family transcriptional regulator [Methylibium sp.]|uniref:TetR/AcrR family transcriptional regulator n=1 Tax=Methylibium sp. TaxID=2067992 RepID=UPI0017CAB387|nr:TetR/AcrR family transcriptional regulator [Methylibium sp.]MBA3598283.1 TetR/AcrR family transcriptional regulator [Methylibium sp.]
MPPISKAQEAPTARSLHSGVGLEAVSGDAKITRRSHNRLPRLLDEAARVFALRGFVAASVREIVEPVGMLPGSLYYHFETKEDLLVAVYREGVRRLSVKVDDATLQLREPWARLEAACVAHLSALLDRTDYSRVVIRIRPDDAPLVAAELTMLRDSYEQRFVALIDELPLPRSVERRDLRLMLMGSLNWSQTWFREDGALSPEEIARRFVRLLKTSLLEP